eukprot:COSAG01_NODE_442_length_17020_cov_26.699622_8_plen_86_part_00
MRRECAGPRAPAGCACRRGEAARPQDCRHAHDGVLRHITAERGGGGKEGMGQKGQKGLAAHLPWAWMPSASRRSPAMWSSDQQPS